MIFHIINPLKKLQIVLDQVKQIFFILLILSLIFTFVSIIIALIKGMNLETYII
ncbi:hypothetical protein ACN4EE_16070 [Geminocystis sp. CENA526]